MRAWGRLECTTVDFRRRRATSSGRARGGGSSHRRCPRAWSLHPRIHSRRKKTFQVAAHKTEVYSSTLQRAPKRASRPRRSDAPLRHHLSRDLPRPHPRRRASACPTPARALSSEEEGRPAARPPPRVPPGPHRVRAAHGVPVARAPRPTRFVRDPTVHHHFRGAPQGSTRARCTPRPGSSAQTLATRAYRKPSKNRWQTPIVGMASSGRANASRSASRRSAVEAHARASPTLNSSGSYRAHSVRSAPSARATLTTRVRSHATLRSRMPALALFSLQSCDRYIIVE